VVQAFALSARLGLCPPADVARVQAHLAAVGLPTDPRRVRPGGFEAGAMLEAMGRDKKVAAGRIRFVLARGIGAAFVSDQVPAEVLRDVLANGTD
jgi:3-dehydroquinate synthetase